MRKLKPYLPAAILLVGVALLRAAHSQTSAPLAGSLTTVLATLSGYTFTDQKISAEEERIAGMSNYVARAYMRDGDVAFTTLVAYYESQTQGKTLHSPRNCLPGAGWEIVTAGTAVVTVDGVEHTVNRYVLRKGLATALAYYWYQGRGRITASEYLVKWNLLRDAAVTGRTEEALVRVVVPVSPKGGGTGGATMATAMNLADTTAEHIAARMIGGVAGVLPGQGRAERDARTE